MLAFEGAKRKLHEDLKYPKEVLDFTFRLGNLIDNSISFKLSTFACLLSSDKFRRGLIIDKKRGNVLKLDRHKYVRKAYHGQEELTAQMRKSMYTQQVTSFTESNYVNIDTIFLLIGNSSTSPLYSPIW